MKLEVWTATLSSEQLLNWLAPVRTQAPFAILERLDDICFPSADETIMLQRWPRGRVFGPDYELRWEQEGDQYRAWLAGTPPQIEGFKRSALLECLDPVEGFGYMWGSNEVRIGRQLDYRGLPKGAGRPQLTWWEFRRPADAALIFIRLTGMRPEENR